MGKYVIFYCVSIIGIQDKLKIEIIYKVDFGWVEFLRIYTNYVVFRKL